MSCQLAFVFRDQQTHAYNDDVRQLVTGQGSSCQQLVQPQLMIPVKINENNIGNSGAQLDAELPTTVQPQLMVPVKRKKISEIVAPN
jgi:hypothetical protein